jgi:phosphatidylethanolamine/phosphatidyl-N-methylethanolamine N-methyltransferase
MAPSSEKFYDRLTILYPVIEVILRAQKRKFFRIINEYPSGRLLEIGVGNGAYLKHYNKHEITAIDASKKMLANARKNACSDMQLFHMNGEALAFQNHHFDYVILSHVISVIDDPEKMLQEVRRVLRPNGKVLILNHFTPDNWLKYVDRSFEKVSKLLFFKSVFRIADVDILKHFTLVAEENAGFASYFKILIYEKRD